MSDISSVCSTPRKKRKVPVTWSYLCRDIGDEDQKEVAVALLEGAEDAEYFVQNSAIAQNAILKAVLGDGSEMVPLVLKNAEQVRSGVIPEMTAVQKLSLYPLAPSASQNMDEETLLSISGTILLGEPFLFESEFREFIDSIKEASESAIGSAGEVATTESEKLFAFYKQHEKNAVGLRRYEASGIPLLGAFLACVVEILNEKLVVASYKYKYQLEFTVTKTSRTPGKNPATDGAVILVVHEDSPSYFHPVIIYEYKPVVDPRMSIVDKKDITELLIQGFYCFRQYEIDECLLCLTDMYIFHYMKVTKPVTTMAIKWAKSISFEEEKQMQEHFSFIAAAI